ncbi:MAG: hypothetical protein V3V06_07510, partial [Dehalococcoidia bacterium]
MSSWQNPILRRGRAKRAGSDARGPLAVARGRVHGRPLLPRRSVATGADLLERAGEEADNIRAEALAAAEMIQAEAQQQVAAAMEAGQQQGYQAGQAAAQAEMQSALELVRSVAGDTKALRDAVLRNSESQLLSLVTAVAGRVVGDV